MKDSSVENLCSREASGLPSTVPPARTTVQFEVERPCRQAGAIFLDDTPPRPFPVWVAWPGEENVSRACDAPVYYRIVGGVPERFHGLIVCEHMGRLIE